MTARVYVDLPEGSKLGLINILIPQIKLINLTYLYIFYPFPMKNTSFGESMWGICLFWVGVLKQIQSKFLVL